MGSLTLTANKPARMSYLRPIKGLEIISDRHTKHTLNILLLNYPASVNLGIITGVGVVSDVAGEVVDVVIVVEGSTVLGLVLPGRGLSPQSTRSS